MLSSWWLITFNYYKCFHVWLRLRFNLIRLVIFMVGFLLGWTRQLMGCSKAKIQPFHQLSIWHFCWPSMIHLRYPFFFPWNGLKWSISDSQESAICLFTARASKQNEIPGSTPWWVISRFLVYMFFYDAQHLCSKQMQKIFHQVIRHVTSGSLQQWFIPDPTLSELSQDHDSKGIGKKGNLIKETLPGWWFGTFGLFFHILDIIWNNNPTWLIFSRGVEPPTSF